jgi:DNA-binding HxlR family transcriptional regulator
LASIGGFGEIQATADARRGAADGAATLDASSVADLLTLLGTGVTGEILAALAPRPLRTASLTQRVFKCAPRTVYRHAGKLAEQGLIVREEGGGVPSVVTYRLSDRGRGLFQVLDAHLSHALSRAPAGPGEGWWTSLALLGEMWSSGWIAELSSEPRSLTELSDMTPGMSFHQVNRRVHLLCASGLLSESAHKGRGKRYKLTAPTRRRMALIAGVGAWRERHGIAAPQRGLTGPEAATVLRVALPLVKLRSERRTQIMLGVVGAQVTGGGRGTEVLIAKVGRGGYLRCLGESNRPADAWAAGTVDLWLSAVVDGDRSRMRMGGDVAAVEACLDELRSTLWEAGENVAPLSASG